MTLCFLIFSGKLEIEKWTYFELKKVVQNHTLRVVIILGYLFSFVWEKVAKWDLFLIGKKPFFCHVIYEWINDFIYEWIYGLLRNLTWAHKVNGLLLRPKINSNNWNFPYEENIYFLIGNMKKIFQWDKDLFLLNPLIFSFF